MRKLAADGRQYRSFQIGAGDDYGAVLNELRAPDLFAPRRAIACRVLRSRRDQAETASEDADAGEARASGSGGSEAALVAAIETARGPGNLILLYEKDNAPAKVRRAAEKSALLVNCMRPFDNQIEQYVNAFAQSLGLKLSPAALDLIISRHGGDLAAIANTLGKVMIFAEPGKAVQPAIWTRARGGCRKHSSSPTASRADAPRQRWRSWAGRSRSGATSSRFSRSRSSR